MGAATSRTGSSRHGCSPRSRGFSLALRLARRNAILLVGDLLHPLDDLAVERFLNRDVSHCRRGCGAVPVLFVRRKPHHVAGPDLLDWPTRTLRETAAAGHDQRLT